MVGRDFREREMNFDSERRAGGRSLVKFRGFDGIGEVRREVWGRGVVQRKGFGVPQVSIVVEVRVHSFLE